MLFPNNPSPLPSALTSISQSLRSAPFDPPSFLRSSHPSNPSCAKTFLTYVLTAFPPLAKFFTLVFTVFSLPRYRSYLSSPFKEVNLLAKRVLRMTLSSRWPSAQVGVVYAFLPTPSRVTFFPLKGGSWAGSWADCGDSWKEKAGGRTSSIRSE